MGQIVSTAAKPKRCNLNQLSQVPTPAAGEHILVSSDNSMNAAGQGNFDCYIEGNGTTAATALELKALADNVLNANGKDSVTGKCVFDSLKNGITDSQFAYSTFTSQTPNITPSSAIALSQAGDFLEIKVKAKDNGFILRRNFSYNQPRIHYSSSNNLQIRFTPSASPFNYQDSSVDTSKVQVIRLELTSVSSGDYTYDVYLDGVKVGTTTQTSANYAPYWEQIGYQTTMDLYYIKGKSGGVTFEYTKFSEMTGATGVTDIYENTTLRGLAFLNDSMMQANAQLVNIQSRIGYDNMFYAFDKTTNVWAADSCFRIFQRIYGNTYLRTNLIYYNGEYAGPKGYWRIERTDIGTLVNGEFNQQYSQAITAGENEFVLQWSGGSDYNFSGGYSGGFHYGETVEDSGCFAEFYVDGKKIQDLSSDIPLTPCNSFFYKELSTIYQHHDDTIAAWHYKRTEFLNGGYKTFNEVQFVQALDWRAYFGIVCVGRDISTYAMPEGADTLTDMGDGSTTISNQFSSHNHSIHYEGNGYGVDVESHIIIGDDSQNTLVVYNSSAYNKFYRDTPTITGSVLNRGAGETTVVIYPVHDIV